MEGGGFWKEFWEGVPTQLQAVTNQKRFSAPFTSLDYERVVRPVFVVLLAGTSVPFWLLQTNLPRLPFFGGGAHVCVGLSASLTKSIPLFFRVPGFDDALLVHRSFVKPEW